MRLATLLLLLLASPAQAAYYLIGPITSYDVVPLQAYLSKTAEPTILIHSPGGEMGASLALVDAVNQHGKVRCEVIGLAASGAFGLLQACAYRTMSPLARLVTHAPRTFVPVPIDEPLAEELLADVRKYTKQWGDVCSRRLKVTRAEYDARVRGKDWVMYPEEALAVGAVDAVQ